MYEMNMIKINYNTCYTLNKWKTMRERKDLVLIHNKMYILSQKNKSIELTKKKNRCKC